MAKIYHWLKLWWEYWYSNNLLFIRAQENGEVYLCFFIDLLMLCLNTKEPGVLRCSDELPYTPETLSKLTGINPDHVRVAMALFQKVGLLEICENRDIVIPDMVEKNLVGSITDSALRMRRFRERKRKLLSSPQEASQSYEKALQCDVEVKRLRVKEEKRFN